MTANSENETRISIPEGSPSAETLTQLPPHGPNRNPFPSDFQTSDREPTACNVAGLVLASAIFVVLVVGSPNPWYALLFAILAVLPAGLIGRFLLNNFKDEAVPNSFLFKQFFIGAVPLIMFVVFIETAVSVVFILLIFRPELKQVQSLVTDGSRGIVGGATLNAIRSFGTLVSHQKVGSGQQNDAFPEKLFEISPFWKVILFAVLTAFIVAGVIEEVGKWIVAQRYKKVDYDPENYEAGRKIGCRGILAVACMGALGFATIENIAYVLGLSMTPAEGFPFELVGMALLRGFLAFPVHVGAQFYVGVSAAQRYVFQDPSNVSLALFIAVLFHGSFDTASLVVAACIKKKLLAEWTIALVFPFHIFLVILLLLLCRGRYKALLERERIVMASTTF